MLQIDSLLIEAFYTENKDFLIGARVQKIQQPTSREIILKLRNQGESRKLYININPAFYHICFMDKNNEARRNIEIPKQPPMFCMLLRKHMEGAKIINVNRPNFERILELNFENYNELGDKIEECLAIELMGKHSNVILYNSDNNIIIGCAHNIGAEKSKERELAGGLPYIYPPKLNKKNLLSTKFANFKDSILKTENSLKIAIANKYHSLSQALIEEICKLENINSNISANLTNERDLQILFLKLHELLENKNKKYSTDNEYSKFSCINNLGIEYKNVNNLIDDYFAHNIELTLTNNLKQTLTQKINKDLKKQINIQNNQQKQIEKKDKAKMYMTKGNLLTANTYIIKKGTKSIDLIDYETNKSITIELDENLTAIENAQKYFNLYNKTKKAWIVAEELLEKTKDEINYLNQILYEIQTSTNLKELKEISDELRVEKDIPKNKKQEKIYIEKIQIDGFDIYIGKNGKQNDYIYSKISSPNDIWFHTLNTPGSHIIVKAHNSTQKLKDPTILKIAQLAKEYSTAKNSTKVSVIYTQRKYIKRPNNTKSGFVVYKNETEIVTD